MTPSQISAYLRRIAAKIDASKRPSAALVAKDVSSLIRRIAINEGGQGDSVFMRLDELLGDLEKNPEVKKLVEQLKKTIEGGKEPEKKVATSRPSSIASRIASRWLRADNPTGDPNKGPSTDPEDAIIREMIEFAEEKGQSYDMFAMIEKYYPEAQKFMNKLRALPKDQRKAFEDKAGENPAVVKQLEIWEKGKDSFKSTATALKSMAEIAKLLH